MELRKLWKERRETGRGKRKCQRHVGRSVETKVTVFVDRGEATRKASAIDINFVSSLDAQTRGTQTLMDIALFVLFRRRYNL